MKVSVPCMKAHMQLSRMEESIRPKETAQTIAKKGQCNQNDITVGPIRIALYSALHSDSTVSVGDYISDHQ